MIWFIFVLGILGGMLVAGLTLTIAATAKQKREEKALQKHPPRNSPDN
jgi:NhaP-type Na+/H+ or K+/H+ antiporter